MPPRPSSRLAAEAEEGHEAEAGETMKGTCKVCITTGPWKQGSLTATEHGTCSNPS